MFLAPSRNDAVAPVERGEQSADRHDDTAQPDPYHQRLVVDAHAPGAVLERLAERDVQVARQPRVDRRFGHRLVLRVVDTLFGMQGFDGLAVAQQLQRAARGAVVRPFAVTHAVEAQRVAADRRGFTRAHAQILFGLEGLHPGDADDEDADAGVGDQHAELRAADRAQLLPQGQRRGLHLQALHEGADARGDHPAGEQEAQCRERAPAAHGQRQPDRRRHRNAGGPAQALRQLGQLGLLPARDRADRHEEHGGHHQRHEHGLEVRRADRDLAQSERIQKQRVERAEHHRACGDRQHHVVHQQHRLARDQLEASAEADLGRAPGEQRERGAGHQREKGKDEDAALGIGGERVHRGQHARAHQEGAEQRQREGENRQQHGPGA